MTQALQIGPLALPYDLLNAAGAVALGWFVGRRLGRAAGIDAAPLLTRMLLLGLVAARLAFVWQWRGPYLEHPASLLDIRDGGWDAAAGIAAAGLYAAFRGALRDGRDALRRPLLAAVLTTGMAWGVGTSALTLTSREAVALPPLVLPSLQGEDVALAAFAGKPSVVNLWASWCPPCQREMPVLQAAQAAHPDLNFVFVDQGESPDAVGRFLERRGLRLHNVLVDGRSALGAALGERALPTTLFFDARGRLVDSRVGELSEASLLQRLARLRAASPPSQLPSTP